MKTINLRYCYPCYAGDVFVEVSDEMAEVMVQFVREMYNYDRRTRCHKAFYSLDAFEWTEKYALEHSPSAEEIILMKEEQAARWDHRGDHPKTPALSERVLRELSTAAFLDERERVPDGSQRAADAEMGWRGARAAGWHVHASVLRSGSNVVALASTLSLLSIAALLLVISLL